MGEFGTVEGFWDLYSHMVRPNDVTHSSDWHLFKKGIKPMWEVSTFPCPLRLALWHPPW